jgi:hypothetical protein
MYYWSISNSCAISRPRYNNRAWRQFWSSSRRSICVCAIKKISAPGVLPYPGVKFETSAAARVINWQTRKRPKGWNIHPAPAPSLSPPVSPPRDFAAVRCRVVDLPPRASSCQTRARHHGVPRAGATTAASTDGYKRHASARLI